MLFDPQNSLLDIILPRRCLACKTNINSKLICEACLSLCNPCPMSDTYEALYFYEFTIQDIIKSAKFNKNNQSAYLLLNLVKNILKNSNLLNSLKNFEPDAVTFVPSHWSKKLTHSIQLPILFARILSQELKIPLVSTLVKNKFGFTQSAISSRAQRLQNIQNMFSLKNPTKKFNKLILADDIVTTGATFDETKKILKYACSKLRCVAIARTP